MLNHETFLQVSRRQALATGGLLAVTAATGSTPRVSVQPEPSAQPRRVLRLAHLTDVHVQPERKGGEGMAACLRHVHALADKPDLILFGGDNVMDVMLNTAERAKVQLDLWRRVLADECGIDHRVCVGNHDVWGWDKAKSKTTGDEPTWGKKWALEAFALERTYHHFERAGWRFAVLDSTFPMGDGYTACLDDEQFEWLGALLAGTTVSTPVLILSHIPIISACAYFDGNNEQSGDWIVPGSWMHTDARRLKDLFLKHPNVKLALSGHIHLVDRGDYCGVSYLCNGAVSGAWWGGDYHECKPGYGIVDLFDDGSFQSHYVAYGWQSRE